MCSSAFAMTTALATWGICWLRRSKDGLGPVRVMRTTGMMGEVVGKAAAICIEKRTTPRGVYEKHLAKLQVMMRQPGRARVS
jgi:hypothetical protein